MAIRPSRQALEELNNARANKKQQLAQAYAELGGRNTALTPNYASNNPVPTASIPTLEKAVVSQYEQAQNSGGIQNVVKNTTPETLLNLKNLMDTIRGPYGNEVQENANLYRELKNQATERAIANTETPEVFTMPTVMGMGNGVYGMPTVEQKGKGVTRSDLQSLYDEQNRAKKNKRARDIASAHPVIGSAMATISRPIESAEGVLQNLGEYATGKALSQTYNPSAEMREQVNEGIKSDLGRIAYGGVNSISDMALAMLLAGGNPNLSSGIMGLEKANDVTNDANARGLTPNQILAEGALSGVSTALTERLPMGRFANGGHIAGSMLSEGVQEGAEDIVDTFFDELVTKLGGNYDKSTLRTEYNQYLEAGYTPEEAQKAVEDNYKKQLGLDVLLGGITGGLMQGGANLVSGNNVITGKPRTQTEENIPTVNAIDDVPEDALQTEEPTARAIPSINSIEQEQQIQNQRTEELRALQEAMQNNPVQTEEQIPTVTPEVQPTNEVAQPTQNVPELNSVIQRAESAVNTFLNGYNSNVLGIEEANDLRNELVALGRQNPEAQGQINNLWQNVVNTVRGNQTAQPSQNQGIQVYRGSNRSTNPLESNLVREKNVSDFISNLKENTPDLLPLSYYTESQDVARDYAKQDLDYYNLVGPEAYRTLTGREDIPVEGEVKQYSINPQNVFDITELGEKVDSDTLYDYLRTKLGPEFEKAFPSTDYFNPNVDTADEGSMYAYQLLRNSGATNTGDTGTRFYNLLRKLGYDAVRYAEQGTNQYAVFPNESEQQTTPLQTEKDSELDENIADIKTLEDAENVIMPEVEKIDKLLRYDIQFLSGENEEESIPTLKDNGIHTGIYKTSDFATNTFPRSQTMTEEEYKSVIPEDIRKTERVTHEATLNKAEENVKRNGYSGEYDRLLKDDNWDAVDVDTAMLCAMRNAESARSAEAAGVDPTEAWNREVELFKKIRSQATAGGQMIEAFKKWSAMTPEGKLGQAIAFINETVTEDKNDLRLKKEAQTAADRLLSDEFMAEFLKKAHQYDGQDVSAAKQARLEIELAHMVNEQIPVKFRQKFTSLWMDNLLASFRTLISRNFGGNIGKAALDQTLVKAISKPIDKFIARYTGTRTTTGLTKEGLKTYAKGFKKGAKQTLRDYWNPNYDPDTDAKLKDLAKEIEVFADANVTNRAGVDENNFKETIKNNRTTFKNKALKLYDKCIKFGLAFGDNPFYQGAYDQTLYELNTLHEEGKLKLPEDITDTEFETWAKTVATAQGLEAVYQDNSQLAEGAMDVKKGLAKMSKGYVGVDILSGASMPFVRTPMNVVKSNLELSPLGVVKNALTTIQEIRSNLESGRSAFDSESFDQRRFVRETSRNAVGTLMFIVGLMLKNAGLLTGGYSDDPREKQAQKDAGMQEYALVSPFTGNQWSINWIPGIGSAFTSASAFDDAYRKPDQDTIDAIANGVKAGSQSMFEQAALQGLQRLTGSANYSSDNKLVDNVAETIANTASSAILPSFVRQTAAALDPYKRNTYGMGGKESVMNNAIAGIPFLRQQLLEPRIGLNGQPMEQNAGRNGLEKWFDNLVNPAMVTVPSALEDPVRDEATRLYEATKDTKAYQPKIGLDYLNVDGHQATTEEYTEFLQIADSAMNQIASDFIQSNFYSGLTDEQKVNALDTIYGAVQRVERAKYLGLDKDFDSEDKAYAEGGAEGLIDFITAQNALANLGITNNEENRNAVLQTLNANGGDLSALTSQYQGAVGRTNTGLDDIMNNEYRDMLLMLSNENMTDLRFDLNSVVNGVEFNSMTGLEKDYQGAKKAYDNGGVNGLAEYMFPAAVLNQYGMDNSEKNRQTVMDAYNEGGATAVRTQLNAMQTFANTDYGEGLITKYNHATQYLPTLNPQQFTNLFDDINQQSKGETGFNNITQQEIIDYLNLDPGAYNNETALQYWYAFDQNAGTDDQWKKIPVLVNGVWTLKKA